MTGLDHQGLLILNNAEYIDTSDFSKHTHYCFTAATGLSILKNFLSPNTSGSKVAAICMLIVASSFSLTSSM